jgi:hypothetical protein
MKVETRETPLPQEMQGRWVAVDEPTSTLVIAGGDVTCFGAAIEYDYKTISEDEGALTVQLEIDDETQRDSFSSANLNGFVITPDGDFLGYNVKSSVQFIREE